MELVWIGLFFCLGLFLGFSIGFWKLHSHYTGTIYVSKDREKTVYQLELDEYPDEIRFKKEVVFKVDASKYDKMAVRD